MIKMLSAHQALTFGVGLLHEYKSVAKNKDEREIRNCYADSCSDSKVSGGGEWPDPKNAYYLTVGYEFDALGNRP